MKIASPTVCMLASICLPSNAIYAQDSMQRQVNRVFSRAIVKIEVSGRSPQYDQNGADRCKSEGMGFFVRRDMVISALHVTTVPNNCDRIIVVRSAIENFEAIAEPVGSLGDVVALRIVDASPPSSICSLVFEGQNIYDETAVRFAMPATLTDPQAMSADIDIDGQFSPNVRFSPGPVHEGDSGGPIVRLFRVIGMTKERLTNISGYGIMVPVEQISRLLISLSFQEDGSYCNPLMFTATPFSISVKVDGLDVRDVAPKIPGYLSPMPGNAQQISPPFGSSGDVAHWNNDVFGGNNSVFRDTNILGDIVRPGNNINSPPGAAAGSDFQSVELPEISITGQFIQIRSFPTTDAYYNQLQNMNTAGLLKQSIESEIWSAYVESLSEP